MEKGVGISRASARERSKCLVSRPQRRWALDGLLSHVTLALSGLLFVSPWLLDYSGLAVAAWTAWISAIVIAIFSLAATIHFAEWEEWVALVGGVWLLVAPWALQFAYFGGATVAFTGVGCFHRLDFGFRFMGRDPPQAQQSENRFCLSPWARRRASPAGSGPSACDGRARRV